MLRSGGLGVRDLKAAAVHLHLDESTTALVVETAHTAGLLGTVANADGNPVWVPTDAYDAWVAQAPGRAVGGARARLARQRTAARTGGHP